VEVVDDRGAGERAGEHDLAEHELPGGEHDVTPIGPNWWTLDVSWADNQHGETTSNTVRPAAVIAAPRISDSVGTRRTSKIRWPH